MQQHRALILRSNRFLGSSLVDKGMVSVADLEAANEKFMDMIQSSELRNASILTTLLYDMKVLEEAKLFEHTLEEHAIGLIDLDQVELHSLRSMNVDMSLCWASSTIPFDKVEDTYLVATCYYMSSPVVKHWEEQLGANVIWYATSISSMTRALERIESIHEAEDAAAVEEEESG